MRTHVTTALAALRWALSFHRRHLAVVTALMAVPALQRFVVMSWDLPGPAAVASEVIVMAARIGLIVYVVRRIGPAPHAWRSAQAFLRQRWPSLLVTLALLTVAFVIFDVTLERIVPQAVPDAARDAYRSALFALKNLTVIPFTMIWLVAVIRQVVRHPVRQPVDLAAH